MPDWVPSDNLSPSDPDDLVTRVGDVLAIHEEISHTGIPGVGAEATVFFSESDPGAVGAGAIWVRPHESFGQSVLIRDEGDAAWVTPALIHYGAGTVANPTVILAVYEEFQISIPAVEDTAEAHLIITPGATNLAAGEAGIDIGYGGLPADDMIVYAETLTLQAGTNLILTGIPTTNPEIAGALYTDGAPAAGSNKPLLISGGPA